MKALTFLARASAIASGLMMTFITLLTCASIVGRELLGKTVPGDFELVGLATGAATALFMPLCQLERGNIIVDFFTTRASKATQGALDRLGALLLSAVMALMSWRSFLGGLSAWKTQAGSMMLGFPEWAVYVCMVPPLLLCTLIALVQAVRGVDRGAAAGQREATA